jgi:hypothetical protein
VLLKHGNVALKPAANKMKTHVTAAVITVQQTHCPTSSLQAGSFCVMMSKYAADCLFVDNLNTVSAAHLIFSTWYSSASACRSSSKFAA